ncbi:lysophospholipid acyltransferase family protein [Luteitalea sp.]|uniref:lysophospholipid acyltransferase family protein n=1 Tax=Luteitalea sp. TaxID=2004800 RepID=UPI0025BAB20F|nr:lysophospholipid acyltransferase family protein [Luteitalea sp.]
MSDRPGWQQSAARRRQVAIISAVGAPLVGALGRTWRFTSEGVETYDRLVAAGQHPILTFWHGRILPATVFWRDRQIAVMTSENFDGEWIARIIERFGFSAVRGSTSRGGVKALVQMKRLVQQGRSVAFTIDGPRGPAERAQPGAVWLAKATGQPILPFHVEAAPAWHARSWDRAQVPTPFSRIAVAVGDPMRVEADADEVRLEERRRDLEAALGRLRPRALALLDSSTR